MVVGDRYLDLQGNSICFCPHTVFVMMLPTVASFLSVEDSYRHCDFLSVSSVHIQCQNSILKLGCDHFLHIFFNSLFTDLSTI
jgi:hypothetical protein